MHAAALRVELRIPDVHSLKEKRHRMSILTTDLRKAFPAAALAEVGFQDQWQRSSLGAALVAADPIIAIDLLDRKLEMARDFGATHLINAAKEDPVKAVRALTSGGGPAANASVTVARMGLKAGFSGYLGNDAFGDLHLLELQTAGVQTDWVVRGDNPTPISTACFASTASVSIRISRPSSRGTFARRGTCEAVSRMSFSASFLARGWSPSVDEPGPKPPRQNRPRRPWASSRPVTTSVTATTMPIAAL